jgi:tetratricopeptide (TPR) repeat protein
LEIHPPTRQVVRDSKSETLEPRVMQVLVAFARSPGAILTRDDLIETCWDGRIVSENAINRVISRVRQIAAELGPDAFQLETITKVGYRILVGEPPQVPPISPDDGRPVPRFNRRLALAGGVTALGATALGAFYWMRRGHVPNAEARAFYQQGMRAQYQGTTDTSEQAEAYFRQAVEADPMWADAWGSLAMSYRHLLDGETDRDQWRLVDQTISAARRALALDPANGEALVALALILAPYRNWTATETRYRELLARFPKAFVLRGHLSRLMQDVGRFEDAVALSQLQVQQQPFVNGASVAYVRALWGAGRLQEAESESARGIKLWPRHAGVWFTRFALLTYTGQPGAAIAFASDADNRPPRIPATWFDGSIAIARALQTRAPQDIDAAKRVLLASLPTQGNFGIATALPFFAAIGDIDSAFALADAHFFDHGRFALPSPRPIGKLTRRDTSFLFRPTVAGLRRDPRFQATLERIGLERYWRQTGTAPDYRRVAGF